MKKPEGKIAVITGGSSGIGLATARRFVEEGAHVVITGRREKELKEAAAVIKENVTTVVGDVARLDDLDRLYAVVKEKHGHIDCQFASNCDPLFASNRDPRWRMGFGLIHVVHRRDPRPALRAPQRWPATAVGGSCAPTWVSPGGGPGEGFSCGF
jgi:hypothetical protein